LLLAIATPPARRSDGTVVAWGDNSLGQCNVPPLPPGTTYVEVAAGADYTPGYLRSNTLAHRNDGAIVVWGDTSFGQADVPTLPAGIGLSELAAGGLFTVARLGSGSSCIPPSTYCVAKTNSLGCTPSIGWQGLPMQGGADTAASTAWQTSRELVSAGLSPSDVSRPVALLSSRGARAASVPPL